LDYGNFYAYRIGFVFSNVLFHLVSDFDLRISNFRPKVDILAPFDSAQDKLVFSNSILLDTDLRRLALFWGLRYSMFNPDTLFPDILPPDSLIS